MHKLTQAFALIVAVFGVCLGVADIAMAGPGNSNGCKTTLYAPISGSAGIFCGETTCTTDCHTVELQDFPGVWICTCADNPQDMSTAFTQDMVCVTAVEVISATRMGLKCFKADCPFPCVHGDAEVTEGDPPVVVGIDIFCECPAGS